MAPFRGLLSGHSHGPLVATPVVDQYSGEDVGPTIVQSGVGMRPPGGGNWQVLAACTNGSRPLPAPSLICGEGSNPLSKLMKFLTSGGTITYPHLQPPDGFREWDADDKA